MLLGYARVSKGEEQDTRMQETALRAAGVERLQKAFQAQGIQFVIDPDAQAILKLGMGKNTPFALYCEEVTAAELIAEGRG